MQIYCQADNLSTVFLHSELFNKYRICLCILNMFMYSETSNGKRFCFLKISSPWTVYRLKICNFLSFEISETAFEVNLMHYFKTARGFKALVLGKAQNRELWILSNSWFPIQQNLRNIMHWLASFWQSHLLLMHFIILIESISWKRGLDFTNTCKYTVEYKGNNTLLFIVLLCFS